MLQHPQPFPSLPTPKKPKGNEKKELKENLMQTYAIPSAHRTVHFTWQHLHFSSLLVLELLQWAIAAWIPLWSSSTALSAEEANVNVVAERRPLLEGDVLMEVGADSCPFFFHHPSLFLRYGLRRSSCFSPKKISIMLAYLFAIQQLMSNPFFFFFLTSSLSPLSPSFRHFLCPKKKEKVLFPILSSFSRALSRWSMRWRLRLRPLLVCSRGRLKLPAKTLGERGAATDGCDGGWRWSWCPWENMSPAEGKLSIVAVFLLYMRVLWFGMEVKEGWRELEKEKSWAGEVSEDGGGGGGAPMSLPSFSSLSWSFCVAMSQIFSEGSWRVSVVVVSPSHTGRTAATGTASSLLSTAEAIQQWVNALRSTWYRELVL